MRRPFIAFSTDEYGLLPLKLHFRTLWDSTLAEAARIVDYDGRL